MDTESLRERIEAVVIGTSAGGVEALSALLPGLDTGRRVSFFVVVHLPRERPSFLSDIFVAKCAVAVREAEDKMPVAAGTVYFAPPDYHLLVDSGPSLALSIDEPVHYSRPSIDVLFESAADIYRDRLMGVILTGANADGAAGLAAVAAAGGVTVVQDPLTAQAGTLPSAAIKRGRVDLVLTLAQIRELLCALR